MTELFTPITPEVAAQLRRLAEREPEVAARCLVQMEAITAWGREHNLRGDISPADALAFALCERLVGKPISDPDAVDRRLKHVSYHAWLDMTRRWQGTTKEEFEADLQAALVAAEASVAAEEAEDAWVTNLLENPPAGVHVIAIPASEMPDALLSEVRAMMRAAAPRPLHENRDN
jgi:hypothetical protein